MPASEELADLFDAYNGIAHDDPAFVANNTEAITDTEKTARAKFEKMRVTGLVQKSLLLLMERMLFMYVLGNICHKVALKKAQLVMLVL